MVHIRAPIKQYVVDFQIDKIAIEVFGDFWHKPISKMKFNTKPERDRIKAEVLKEAGYQLEVFWESEVITTPEKTIGRLREIFCASNQ